MNHAALHAGLFMRSLSLERAAVFPCARRPPLRAHESRDTARRIAAVILAGPRDNDALGIRLRHAFMPASPWLLAMAIRLLGNEGEVDFSSDGLARRIEADDAFVAAASGILPRLRGMRPIAADARPPRLPTEGLPALQSPAMLANWLGIGLRELDWFATRWRIDSHTAEGKLRHYRYSWRAREYGADRLIEAPKARLAELQRRVHAGILMCVPVHAAAQGFVRGRSVLTHAALHVGRAWVMRIDLEQFFTSIHSGRVRGVLEMLGYPFAVAAALAALCTNRAPTAILQQAPHGPLVWHDRQRYAQPHLPQGAPTSPALANLVAWQLDVRLHGWAQKNGWTYSRYADDLTFSTMDDNRAARLRASRIIAAIALDCGFAVNHRKTMAFGRQHAQRVTGLVVNERPGVSRADFDRLKAILTRCANHGPGGENRAGHPDFKGWLRGTLGWHASLVPHRAAKLQRLFAKIDWS